MPNIKSAKKRLRQNVKQRARNRWRKISIRSEVKDYHELILHGTVEEAQAQLTKLYKLIDITAAKGVIHKNTADRNKSRLSALLNKKQSTAAAA